MEKLKINITEVWKDINGYEGLYQVSDMGRVKRLPHVTIRKNGSKLSVKERILRTWVEPNGYLRVNLSNGSGKVEKFSVHRLVCGAFHENPENKPCVNHIDENKTNNAASNLEWCTYAENNNHGTHIARTSKPVGQYTKGDKLIKVWQSLNEVQRQLGFRNGNISRASQGKRKTAYGYVWKYIEEGK